MTDRLPSTLPAGWGEYGFRAWRPEEAPWYLTVRDDEIFRWTRESPDLTEASFCAAIDRGDGSERMLAIVDGADAPLGSLTVRLVPGSVELAYWVAPAARNRGIATNALRAASTWAAQTPGVSELTLVMHPANVESKRVGERVGYTYDGKTPAPHACDTEDGLVDRYVLRVSP